MSFASHQQRKKSQRSTTMVSSSSIMFLLLVIVTLHNHYHLSRSLVVAAFQPISLKAVTLQNNNSIKNRIDSSTTSFSSSLYAENQQETTPSTYPSSLSPRRAQPPRPGEFELQELKVNLDSMRKQNVASRDLSPIKKLELQGYATKITQSIPSSIPLEQLYQVLPGTKWRLQFSTQPLVGADSPPDATITLTFHDNNNNVMDYSLEFSKKTLGLNAIKAMSKYTVEKGQDANAGLVTFVYNEIKTDAFGFKDIPTGFFGMLKGRSNYIQSVYMDNQIWIERCYASPENGQVYYNVYVKESRDNMS